MSRPRIVIADDYPPAQEVCRRLLSADFDVLGAVGDGRALMEIAERMHPDIVVMDITMPLLNGLETTRLLKTQMPEIKVVLLTAHTEQAYREAAYNVGADAFVLKGMMATRLRTILIAVAQGQPVPC